MNGLRKGKKLNVFVIKSFIYIVSNFIYARKAS